MLMFIFCILFCFIYSFYYISVMFIGLAFGIPFESPPFDDAEIPTYVTVSEEIITGKNGGRFDGTIYRVSVLNDEELKEVIASIENNPNWQKGALSDELKEELTHVNSFDSENPMFSIDNGYFLFKDEHADALTNEIYTFDSEIVRSRGSYNYIISALDVKNKTLYYFQLDT